jgi:hypothetical protein
LDLQVELTKPANRANSPSQLSLARLAPISRKISRIKRLGPHSLFSPYHHWVDYMSIYWKLHYGGLLRVIFVERHNGSSSVPGFLEKR